MGKFSKIFHHIESKDLRNKYEQKKAAKIKEEKKKEDTKKYVTSVMEYVKYDWRSGFDIGATLREGMTTSDVAVTKQIDAAPGDGDVSSLDAIDASSYTPTIGVLAANDDLGANVGTQIRASGSGTGQDGGFNVGGNYLAFQGTGTGGGNARFAVLSPIDSTEIDTLKIRAIVGNDSNGGEDPDASGEELYVMYKTRDMPEAMFLIQRPDGSIDPGISGTEDQIIPIGAAPNAGLNDYSLAIPDYARAAGTQFILIQAFNSGVGFDNYGITEIKFQRKAPITVFVPLDNPEASSFIRSAPEGSTPKKRKKDVNDKLEASDEYTQAKFGNEFPGQEVRVGGEDPFKGAEIGDDVEPSPQGKDEVKDKFARFQKSNKKSFTDFKNLTDQQKVSQSDEFINDYIKTFNDDTYTDPESIAILDRAIELNPKNTDAYFYRSFAHLDNQNYEDALKDTEKILEVDPNDPDVSYIRMIIYQEKGDLELSLEELEKTLETYPDDTYLQDMKADIENQIEQEYRAKQVPPDANEEGGVVKRQTYYDEVSKNLAPEDTENQQLVSTNLAQAKDLMTSTHYSFGRDGVFSKGAIELLQDAYAVEPNNPEILSNLGVALMMGGKAFDGEGGEYYLERAQALDPSIKFDFNINSWDRYDGEEQQPYAGPRIDRLASLPYRYARDIIKNLPDQSTVKGAKYGAINPDYAEKYGGSYSKYYTDEAKGKSTEELQRMLVSAARKIEDNKYWMEDLSRHPSFRGSDDIIGVPGYALGATKWTGALNGVTLEDYYREQEKLDNMVDEYGYYQGDWRTQWDKVKKTLFQANADDRSRAVSAGVKQDVEKYQAYYDEYMRRGQPDAIEKVDVPEAGKFIETAQKEIIEKAISEPEKLFKLSDERAETLRKVLTPQGGKGGDSLEYTANLPFALGISILTGKPMELFVSDAEAIKIAQDINADELAKVLRIDNPVPTTARETIEPSEGKTDKVITSLFGKQGGLYFNYDTETKQLYIESRKTLRSTSGGEEVTDFFSSEPPINPKTGEPFPDMYADKNADLKSILFTLPALTGTGSKFSDIPVPTTDKINEIGAKFVYEYLYDPFMKAKATFDALKKTGGNPIEIKNVIFDALAGKIKNPDQLNPNAPRTWNPEAKKMMNMYDRSIAGMKQNFDQNFISKTVVEIATKFMSANVNAIAANTVAIRKILTDIGVPASDIEKFGGAYGMTYSSTPVNYDDLPDDVKAVIDAAVGTPQGKPKEEPKDDSGLGSVGEIGGVDATAAATAAAERRKKNKGKVNESNLYEKLKKASFFNPKDIKPIFPENPPPKLDPKTGMHPQYGKKAGRYKKLDPISANSMPLTGDPETDAIVKKQKTINKIKKMAKKNLKESDFTNITQGNKVGQTFQHTSGATITLDGALGGKMMVPSQVTLSLPFGEGDITVDGPNESDFALTGFTKPLDFKLQKRIADQSKDEINDKLDASEKASGAETAKVEGEGDIWTWTEYMNQLDALSDRYAKMAEPLEKVKLDYINKNEDVPIGIIDKIDAITQALHKAQEALHQKWLAYNKVPDLPPVPDEESDDGDGILDTLANKLGKGPSKSVFDTYMNELDKGKLTSKPYNINNILQNDATGKKEISKLQNIVTDVFNDSNYTSDIDRETEINKRYMDARKTFPNLKNILGQFDDSKKDGFKITRDSNGIVTSIKAKKAFDFTGLTDMAGADVVTGLPAMSYAAYKGLPKYFKSDDYKVNKRGRRVSGKNVESPTMNLEIDFKISNKNHKKKNKYDKFGRLIESTAFSKIKKFRNKY